MWVLEDTEAYETNKVVKGLRSLVWWKTVCQTTSWSCHRTCEVKVHATNLQLGDHV